MLTVFTPTYNRAELLPRVYESLLQQSCIDFEWLIVDDGSQDHTAQVVNSFRNAAFAVRYICKENGGKHTAHNTAVQAAKGEWFLCLDSDDALAENAVEQINIAVRRLSATDCGLLCGKDEFSGRILSGDLKSLVGESLTVTDVNSRGIDGEFAFVFRTDLLRQFPFPVFSDERFIGECVLYDRLELEGWHFRIFDDIVEHCEYQPDGLTGSFNRLMKNNPAGYCLYFAQRIDLRQPLKSRLITAGKYHCFRIFAGAQKTDYSGEHRVLTALCAPLGPLFWVYYKLLRGF